MTQDELLSSRDLWLDAYARGNTRTLRQIEHQGFRVTNERGTQTREE